MAKVKVAALFIVVLLLLSTLTYAARPATAFKNENNHSPANTQQGMDAEGGDDNCEGEEDCMARRTLDAHLDYIYTQKHKP